ncbi:MAG: NAD(P)/FAD-dependent oxidoreductase [Candidatus Zixiibacteriota bacterium]
MNTQASDRDDRAVYDITFIGAGPVAMYGMYYAGLRMMRYKTIDMLGEVGGGLMALYPEKYIYDVAGFPKILAKDLVKLMREQATQYPHKLCLGEKVLNLDHGGNGVITITTDLGVHSSKTVVICAGLGAYIPRRLDVPNVERLEGAGVHYFIRRVADFQDKNVLVVGGGDSAFDYCMMLEPVAKAVTHIHRNDFFSAHEDSIRKVKNSSVRMKYPFWEVKKIEGNEHVENVTIVQTQTGEEERMPVDAIICNIGFLTNLGPIESWGLEIEHNAIKVDRRMRTNIEGVYAAGDIVTYDGKLKLISTGCGEVAVAVNNAKNFIDPKAKVSPGHSTEKQELVLRKWARLEHERKSRRVLLAAERVPGVHGRRTT